MITCSIQVIQHGFSGGLILCFFIKRLVVFGRNRSHLIRTIGSLIIETTSKRTNRSSVRGEGVFDYLNKVSFPGVSLGAITDAGSGGTRRRLNRVIQTEPRVSVLRSERGSMVKLPGKGKRRELGP